MTVAVTVHMFRADSCRGWTKFELPLSLIVGLLADRRLVENSGTFLTVHKDPVLIPDQV